MPPSGQILNTCAAAGPATYRCTRAPWSARPPAASWPSPWRPPRPGAAWNPRNTPVPPKGAPLGSGHAKSGPQGRLNTLPPAKPRPACTCVPPGSTQASCTDCNMADRWRQVFFSLPCCALMRHSTLPNHQLRAASPFAALRFPFLLLPRARGNKAAKRRATRRRTRNCQ